MSLNDLEIIGGEEVRKNLNPGDLENLVNVWMNETSPQVEANALETHEAIQEALDRKGKSDSLIDHLRESIDKGDMIIARVDGKIAGMVRVYDTGRKTKVKDVEYPFFEIGKALVLPEFRNQGIYKKLRAQSIHHLREKAGDVLILTGTKSDYVKKIARDDGWEEIGFDNYLRIYGANEESIEAKHEERIKKDWTAFLHIPAALKQKLE